MQSHESRQSLPWLIFDVRQEMKRASAIVLFSTAEMLLTAGCMEGTSAQRSGSFLPHAATTIAGESLPVFLASRTALLFTGDRLSVSADLTKPGEFIFKEGWSGSGVATAVDPRGYFLTAAHCVGDQASYLVFESGAGIRAEQASVVWRGDSSKHEPDLALLYIGHPVSRVFDWGFPGKPGDRVFAVGPDYKKPMEITVACMSGVILPPLETPKTSPTTDSINHTAPLHHGDSGGPLTDAAGRLLGINVSISLDSYFVNRGRLQHSEAIRPELGWLNDVIAAHADKRPNKALGTPTAVMSPAREPRQP
jgi:S1-C subfamily serine protease